MELERDTLAELYVFQAPKKKHDNCPLVECLIFSKDRAMQLHALLGSIKDKVSPAVPVHVLYHSSSALHQRSYETLINQLAGHHQVTFTRQRDAGSFKQDTLALLEKIQADRIFFLVDDLLFIEQVDLRDLVSFDTRTFVPSLRMGANLKRSYTVQQDQPLPEQLRPDRPSGLLVWKWEEGQLDWGYPLSVDGHIFSTAEIKIISKAIEFAAPNTYEDALQLFMRIFRKRQGVCYEKSKIVNIPCNKVQDEKRNISGDIHQDYLAEQWLNGRQIDYRGLYGVMNISAHQELAYNLIARE